MNNYYMPIDTDTYLRTGAVEIAGSPVSWATLFDSTIGEAPKGNFGIYRTDWLCSFLKVVGGQRGKVAELLVRKKDGRNLALFTNREIASQTGVALATVNATLQELRKADCIKTRTAAIMLNPGISHRGNRQREAFLLELYKTFGNWQDT